MARKPKPLQPVPEPLDVLAEPVYAQGTRSYLVTDVPPAVTAARTVSSKEYPFIAALVAVGAYVRMASLAQPDSVVFDEVHFGGFAKKYILGRFFMDVHPPLAKMLFAAVATLGGFDGLFDFATIGDKYPETVPYVLMRSFPAALGLATVVLCYLTLRASGVRPAVAFVTAACLLFENAYVTISRYILLDAPLVFFIAAAVYAFKKFEVQQPFSVAWWRALVLCALSLGLAFASKWVGLFTIAWVGLCCVLHMWLLIGDLRVLPCAVVKHAAARAGVLLGVPVAIYLFMFLIHFSVLSNDGDGSAFMTSAFRAGLTGSSVPASTNAQVGYGSVVTLRHVNTRGGYLHSHAHFYEGGSKQQQITLYPHLDHNNDWVIEPYNFSIPDTFMPITDGTKIRLRHVVTHRRLHSHDEKPPVSERDWQKEASAYGYEGFTGDANDDWVVEVVKHKTPTHAQDEVRAMETVFRLRHAMSGHYLFSSEVKLPAWGFEQQEVTAASQGSRPLTHWYIETNNNSMLSDPEPISYPKLTFLQKLVESHKTMWKINSGLTSHHNWQSEPHEWPLLLRGINYWSKDHTQIYFLGNPVVWWTATACLLGFVVHLGISIIKWQAGRTVARTKAVFNYNLQMFVYLAGWAVHYVPFFIMGRQLFLHHYLPAHYFAILGLGHFFDLLVSSSKQFRRPALAGLFAFFIASLVAYNILSPLIAGSQWTKSQCLSSKLINGWDYDCNTFFESTLQYDDYLLSSKLSAIAAASSTTSVVNEAKKTVQVEPEVERQQPKESDDADAPPPAETHAGEIPIDENNQVIYPPPEVSEELPQGELFDEATTNSESVPEAVKETDDEPDAESEDAAKPVEPVLEAQEIEPEVAAETVEAADDVVEEAVVVDGLVAESAVLEEEIEEPAKKAGEQIAAEVEAAKQEVEDFVDAVQEQAKQASEAAQEAVDETVKPIAEKATDGAKQVVGAAEDAVQQIVDKIALAAEPVVEAVSEALSK